MTTPELADETVANEGGPDPLEDFFAEIPREASAEPSASAAEGGLESVEPPLDDSDSLAVMERELRELEQQRAADERPRPAGAGAASPQRNGRCPRDVAVGDRGRSQQSSIVADPEQPNA